MTERGAKVHALESCGHYPWPGEQAPSAQPGAL